MCQTDVIFPSGIDTNRHIMDSKATRQLEALAPISRFLLVFLSTTSRVIICSSLINTNLDIVNLCGIYVETGIVKIRNKNQERTSVVIYWNNDMNPYPELFSETGTNRMLAKRLRFMLHDVLIH